MAIKTINDISIVVAGAEKHLEKDRPEIARAWLEAAERALAEYVFKHHSAALMENGGCVRVIPPQKTAEVWQYVSLYTQILLDYAKAAEQAKQPPLSDMWAYAKYMETRMPFLAITAYEVLSRTADPQKLNEIADGIARAQANQDKLLYRALKRAVLLKNAEK